MPDEPLRTTTYTLTSADALAYERASTRPGPLAIVFLIAWLAACGALVLLIPPDWAGPRLSLTFSLLVLVLVAAACVLALILMSWRQLRRARKRLRRPVEMQLVEWPERLEFSGAGLPRTLALRDVIKPRLTRTHLFLETDGEPVVLPRRAFPEEGSIEALEQRLTAANPSPAAGSPAAAAAVDPPVPTA